MGKLTRITEEIVNEVVFKKIIRIIRIVRIIIINKYKQIKKEFIKKYLY